MKRTVVFIALLAVLASARAAMSPEEADRTSWLRQQLGAVTDAHIAGSRAYAVSRQGVLAALNLADGSLAWRRRLEPGASMVLAGAQVLAVEPGRVFAFQASTGTAQWELPTSSPAAVAIIDGSIVVASAGTVQVLTPNSGALLHTVKMAESAEGVEHSVLSVQDLKPLVITWSPQEGALLVDTLDISTGTLVRKGRHTGPTGGVFASEAALVGADRLVVPTADRTTLCHSTVEGEAALDCGVQRTASGAVMEGFSLPKGFRRTGSALGYVIREGAALVAFRRGTLGAIAVVPRGVPAGGAGDENVAAFILPGSGGELELVKLSTEHAGTVGGPALALQAPAGGAVVRAFADKFKILMTVSADGELALFDMDNKSTGVDGAAAKTGTAATIPPVWTRSEALADSVASMFVPLPPPSRELERSLRARQPGALRALRAQWLALKAQLSAASAAELAELAAHRRSTDTRLLPVRDADGFRAQALVLTKPGRLFSLHTGDGHVLWSVDLTKSSGAQDDSAATSTSTTPPLSLEFKALQVWRVPHRLGDAEQVLVLAQGRGANDSGAAFVVDAYAGTVLTRKALPAGALTWLRLPATLEDGGDAAQSVFLCFGADGKEAAVLPDTSEARVAVIATAPGLTLWRPAAAASKTMLEGLRVLVPSAASSTPFTLGPSWSTRLAGPGEQILLAKAVEPSAAATSGFAKIFGLDQVVYRYLNPSLLLVIAGKAVGDDGKAAADTTPSSISVYLLDGVTGRLLWSQVHEDARGPVAGVVSENWATYQFWSARAGRWQVGSVELYDGTPREFSVADLAFIGPANLTRDAWDPVPLQALSRSFYAKYPAATMAVTATKHGITAPQVLFGLMNGQVYMMDRRFLDPRRPVTEKLTAAQQAEGLIPYTTELPLVGPSFETHATRVWGLRELQARPTEMESSALLLARGLDLYGGRLVPRGTYDQVPDSFPFALLVSMGLGMSLGALVLKRLAGNKTAARMWD